MIKAYNEWLWQSLYGRLRSWGHYQWYAKVNHRLSIHEIWMFVRAEWKALLLSLALLHITVVLLLTTAVYMSTNKYAYTHTRPALPVAVNVFAFHTAYYINEMHEVVAPSIAKKRSIIKKCVQAHSVFGFIFFKYDFRKWKKKYYCALIVILFIQSDWEKWKIYIATSLKLYTPGQFRIELE